MGKTTCAAAAALRLAERGRSVLVVSTDPAHSLGDAFSRPLGPRPRRLPSRRGSLRAAELDADAALERWLDERRERLATIALRGTYLDREDVDRFLSLSLPGVDELIGLLELGRLARAARYDDVVVDTAPTGHTLRLLQMPATLREIASVLDGMQAKHRFLTRSLAGSYRPDTADALIAEIEEEAKGAAALLCDPARSAFSWVMLPEALSLEESRDGVSALRAAGIAVGEIVVNRLTPPPPGPYTLCPARRHGEAAVVRSARAAFRPIPMRLIAAEEKEPAGLAALRRLGAAVLGPPRADRERRLLAPVGAPRAARARRPPSRRQAGEPWWLTQLVPRGRRLLMFGGKGGVGKTSAASAAALELAAHRPGRVLLLSADPAHSIGDALQARLGDTPRPVPGAPTRLRARELDADRALREARARYRDAVDQLFDALRGGSHLDPAFDRAVVQDLIALAPPGLDELFAIVAVTSALVSGGARERMDVVVLDTAPTGHALRLLALPDAARQWVQALLAVLLKYREVVGLGRPAEELVQMSKQLRELDALLRDPARTAFVAVTRAAELPRRETERLLEELEHLRIPTAALLVNALTPPGCARCRRTAAREATEVRALARRARSLTGRERPMILAPMTAPEPRGPRALREWSRAWRPLAAAAPR